MLSKLIFENFQGFKGKQEARLAPLTLIFGPNASGKSSIGRALRVLKQTHTGNAAAGLKLSGSEIVMRDATQVIYSQLRDSDQTDLGLGFGVSFPENVTPSGIRGIASIETHLDQDVSDSKSWGISLIVRFTEDVATGWFDSISIRLDKSGLLSFGGSYNNPLYLGDVSAVLQDELGEVMRTFYEYNADWWGFNQPGGNWNFKFHEHAWSFDAADWVNSHSERWPRIESNRITWGYFQEEDRLREDSVEEIATGPRSFLLYALVAEFNTAAEKILASVAYVPPIRPIPERVQITDEEVNAEYQPPFFTAADPVLWLQMSSALLRLTDSRYVVNARYLRDDSTHTTVRLNFIVDQFSVANVTFEEVGTGLSQIYPVLEAIFTPAKKVVYVEQPELHLHPRLQSELMDVFIDEFLKDKTRQFILETHSESMLLRLQKAIRDKLISPEDVSILFVDAAGTDSEDAETLEDRFNSISEIKLDHVGDTVDPLPVSFARLRLEDLL